MKKLFEEIFYFLSGWIPLLLAVGLLTAGLCITVSKLHVTCVSLGLLSVAAIALIKIQRYLQKTIWRVIVFCIIFCMGTWCYYFTDTNNEGDVVTSSCAALAEFFPSRGTYNKADAGTWMRWFYGLSYFFAISLLVGIFGRKLTNKWDLFMSFFFYSKRRIFWCNIPSGKEKQLADRIHKEQPYSRCIFSVEEFAIDKVAELIENLNFNHHLLCLRKPGQMHRASLKAPVHFFLTDNCDWNIRMAQRVWNKTIKYQLKKVDFYIRISDGVKGYWAEKWAEEVQKDSSLEIHLIRESTLIAREMVQKYPLLQSPGIKIIPQSGKVRGDFNVLLLGFAEQGEAILREVVCDGQFLHEDEGKHFKVDIIDKDPVYFSCFAERCREAIDRYSISYININVLSGDFYRFIEENIASYNRIIVAFNDDNLNMEVAAKIVEISRLQDVKLNYSEENKHLLLVRFSGSIPRDAAKSIFTGIDFFGSIGDIYSPGVIINESLDETAKLINLNYQKKQQKTDNWQNLSMFTKDSNNSSAICLRNLCLLMGMTKEDFNIETVNKCSDNLMDVYAETEHLRWNAFHFMHGIRVWDLKDIPVGATKPNDIEMHMRHAALVNFAKLPEVDKLFPDRKPLQENDRDIVMQLKEIFGDRK